MLTNDPNVDEEINNEMPLIASRKSSAFKATTYHIDDFYTFIIENFSFIAPSIIEYRDHLKRWVKLMNLNKDRKF
jgi:hypothetical protein